MQDKVEAFRFKYDPVKLADLENNMGMITWILYINAVLYYILCIGCPIVFSQGCGSGIHFISHIIYGIYALINFLFELWIVIRIQ
mmetsp:Transcript_41316/g.47640  ORF Transcript_41316/g.47640 Transcript_41316/m.47640 type:complete len:85 (+) Transcript_41316:131-385(+)